jgi:hypothetical protein
MSWKYRLKGGVLGFIGFMLSPLSWWNDAVVNLPLALAFAWVIGWVYRPAFEPAMVLGYWLTNVLGFVLMHKGANQTLRPEASRAYTGRQFTRDLLISLGYTSLIVLLLKFKVLQPLAEYSKR